MSEHALEYVRLLLFKPTIREDGGNLPVFCYKLQSLGKEEKH